MSSELTQLITEINSEFNKIAERILLPHFQKMQIIENILKEMPAFKNLENENKFLKQQISTFKVVNSELSNQEVYDYSQMRVIPVVVEAPVVPVVVVEPISATLAAVGDAIKLEIVESLNKLPVSENEIYQDINLKLKVNNVKQEASEVEEEASEVDLEEASEVDLEASEVDLEGG